MIGIMVSGAGRLNNIHKLRPALSHQDKMLIEEARNGQIYLHRPQKTAKNSQKRS